MTTLMTLSRVSSVLFDPERVVPALATCDYAQNGRGEWRLIEQPTPIGKWKGEIRKFANKKAFEMSLLPESWRVLVSCDPHYRKSANDF